MTAGELKEILKQVPDGTEIILSGENSSGDVVYDNVRHALYSFNELQLTNEEDISSYNYEIWKEIVPA